MKSPKVLLPLFGKSFVTKYCLALAFCAVFAMPVRACTIFLLTDTNCVLFCNNEDWSNPKTRIWFVPAATNHYGAAYVGFDDGFAQGGLNSEGLAFDWVAGYDEVWKPDPTLPIVAGNSSQQMIETCATIEEAIAFYRGHQEPGFYRAKILVADRTGTSVIIGAREGKLQVEKSSHCRGFGYGERKLNTMLDDSSQATVANGAKILRTCMQKGMYATKYFNVFDLKTGDIFLYPFPEKDDQVKFNLKTELQKGGHYYDMPQIHEQLAQAPRPLLQNMERFRLDKYKAIPDKEPKVTARIRRMLQDVLDDTVHMDDFTPEAWKEAAPTLKETQATLKLFGPVVSLNVVDRSEEGGKRTYRYRLEFKRATILQQIVFDEQGKLASSQTEDIRMP
jgi:hypothetical protein